MHIKQARGLSSGGVRSWVEKWELRQVWNLHLHVTPPPPVREESVCGYIKILQLTHTRQTFTTCLVEKSTFNKFTMVFCQCFCIFIRRLFTMSVEVIGHSCTLLPDCQWVRYCVCVCLEVLFCSRVIFVVVDWMPLQRRWATVPLWFNLIFPFSFNNFSLSHFQYF